MFRKRNVSFIFIIHREKKKKENQEESKVFFFFRVLFFSFETILVGWLYLFVGVQRKKKKRKKCSKHEIEITKGERDEFCFVFKRQQVGNCISYFRFGGGIGGECSQIRLLCSSQYTHTHVRKLFWIAMKFSLVFWGNIVVQRKHKKQNHFLKLE